MWSKTIVDLRIEAGHSQRSLAKAAGINRNTVRKMEAGISEMYICQLESVLQVLGYELDAIKVQDVPKHVIFVGGHPPRIPPASKHPGPPKVTARRKHKLIRIRLPREV